MKLSGLINKLFAIIIIINMTTGCTLATSVDHKATPTPDPLNVQVSLDEELAASAVISTSGGTLTTLGADGTSYTLTFPEGALLSDENITLTPITFVEGLPFTGGLVGGVQIAPEGLRLLQPATFTIESQKIVEVSGFETVAFAYHLDGEGLYLAPSNVTGNFLTLEVWHFSGYGSAKGTAAEIQTQQQRVPSNPEDAFMQRVQEYLGRERQKQLLGLESDPEFKEVMDKFLREMHDSFIAPQLPIALQDCEAARLIISKALSWVRWAQLLGSDEFQPETDAIMNTLEQAIVNCYNKEYELCLIDKKIVHRTAMLGLARQAQLWGSGDQLDYGKIENCPPATNWKVDWNIPNFFNLGGNAHFTGLSCGSPYGPWKIKMEGAGLWGSYNIPFSEDGRAPVTSDEHGRYKGGLMGYDDVGTGNAVITPNSGGYQISLENITLTGTWWTDIYSSPIPQYENGQGLIFSVIPADPGQCPQP